LNDPVDDGRRRLLGDWALVLAVGGAAGLVLSVLGVPSAPLFGGLVAGLGRALLGRGRLALPRAAGIGAQAVIGVSIGALVQTDTLRTVAEHWLPVLAVTVATLLVSLVAGQLMRLQRGISPVTGAFSMIAGGASGITAMARDLGADEQVVAVLQYLRVLLIVVAMPIVATTVYGATATDGAVPAGDGPGWPAGLLFTAVCVVVGVLLGRVTRLPVGALLGPMAVAAALDLTGLSRDAGVPSLVEAAGFLAIGLQVGLGFTRSSLRLVGRALPLALALIAGAVTACAGLGVVLSSAAGVSPLDGYLATTPGGLYAVLATATGSGADATFVLAVQVLRLFVMLFSAPLLARLLRPRSG
jgi:membrane AbrB-like protein